jgi:predicted RNase H-like HicB family nuclease
MKEVPRHIPSRGGSHYKTQSEQSAKLDINDDEGACMRTFSAYVEWDPETKLYVGIIPGIPGAHTQGASLDELQGNLKEVLELCLEKYKGSLDDLPHFVGLQQVEVTV